LHALAEQKVSPFDPLFVKALNDHIKPLESSEARQAEITRQSTDSSSTHRDTSEESVSVFTEDEEKLFNALLSQMSGMGSKLNKVHFRNLLNEYIQNASNEVNENVSERTVRRMYQAAWISTTTKAYAVDPARSRQADPVVLETFMKTLDSATAMLNKMFPRACPWKKFANVPS
jgi:hypothetical protein